MNKFMYLFLALFAGIILALMLFINGQLAIKTSSYTSSLIVHFIGTFIAWSVWKVVSTEKQILPINRKAPIILYTGGLIGGVIIVLANYIINSRIGAVGLVCFSILGQVLAGIVIDRWGFLGIQKRRIQFLDYIRLLFITAGSILIVVYSR